MFTSHNKKKTSQVYCDVIFFYLFDEGIYIHSNIINMTLGRYASNCLVIAEFADMHKMCSFYCS